MWLAARLVHTHTVIQGCDLQRDSHTHIRAPDMWRLSQLGGFGQIWTNLQCKIGGFGQISPKLHCDIGGFGQIWPKLHKSKFARVRTSSHEFARVQIHCKYAVKRERWRHTKIHSKTTMLTTLQNTRKYALKRFARVRTSSHEFARVVKYIVNMQ